MVLFRSDNVRMAVRNLRRNKARSLLTILGVVIGVASVVLVSGIGEGVKLQVGAQTEHLGKDLITIRPGQLLGRSGPALLTGLGVQASGVLSNNDVGVVTKTPGVASAAPLSLVSGSVVTGEHNKKYDALVIGTSSDLPRVLHQKLAYGAFFGDDSASGDKVVLGSHAADALYDEHVPLGRTLSILGHQFVVSGILDDSQASPLTMDADFNNAVFLPYATARAITNGSSSLYEILARPVAANTTAQVVRRLNDRLLTAHGGQRDFTVLEQAQTVAVADEILRLLTMLTCGVAAIALLVGGVGIMNVMLVSVSERMHEIGIRKAIGATNRQILVEFITEATVLSLVGGLVGVVVSAVVTGVIVLLTSFVLIVTWQPVVIACGVSVGVGVIFGTVPALKAARKDPIAALRHE